MPETAAGIEQEPDLRDRTATQQPGRSERQSGGSGRQRGGAGPKSRWGPGVWAGVWAVVNLALGVVLAYPFMLVLVIGLHARAMLFDRPDSPFSNNEIQGGEADGFIPFGIFLTVLILAVVTAINWALIRRLRLPGRAAKTGMVLVTAALLIAPSLVIF